LPKWHKWPERGPSTYIWGHRWYLIRLKWTRDHIHKHIIHYWRKYKQRHGVWCWFRCLVQRWSRGGFLLAKSRGRAVLWHLVTVRAVPATRTAFCLSTLAIWLTTTEHDLFFRYIRDLGSYGSFRTDRFWF
jgi:hypothetical protein